jgi:hypothetical protein
MGRLQIGQRIALTQIENCQIAAQRANRRAPRKAAYDVPGGSDSHREEPPLISNMPESRV